MNGSYPVPMNGVDPNLDSMIQQNLYMLENSLKMNQFNQMYYNMNHQQQQICNYNKPPLEAPNELFEEVYPFNAGYNYSPCVEDPRTIKTSTIDRREETKSNWLSPNKVIELYYDQLTPYEKNEIFSYSKIYFVGSKAADKKMPGTFSQESNYGYDDAEGGYIHVTHDHVAYR